MNQQPSSQPRRSGGFLWGPERVASGISLNLLAKEAKINVGFISRMEHGLMIPRAEEYQRIHAALKRLQQSATIAPSATAEG
jgi:transcriptional regulator with XRE-family HTH domain